MPFDGLRANGLGMPFDRLRANGLRVPFDRLRANGVMGSGRTDFGRSGL
jgi:hypothetical protein